MPIYEYQCQSCGERLEELQGINDPHLTVCPACGGELKRMVSSPAFQFKGSGWYVTDYAKSGAEGKGKGGSSSADGGSSSGGDSESKSDSSSSGSKSAGSDSGSDSGSKTETKSKSGSDGGSSSKAS